MSIAVDQTRLRRIVHELLPSAELGRTEALTMVQFVQLAAGVERDDDPMEHAILLALLQHINTLAGLEPSDELPTPGIDDERTRTHWLASLAVHLHSRAVRELTYALVFLVSVADLQLTAIERASLEEFQRALGLDDRRATDLVVFLTEIVAASESAA